MHSKCTLGAKTMDTLSQKNIVRTRFYHVKDRGRGRQKIFFHCMDSRLRVCADIPP